ncbi:hypothetical protein ERJ75_000534000 [Trypanosoma vivax]|nr:hypothetical protein ERJ75_000534000 [Trypanosoma vivax]
MSWCTAQEVADVISTSRLRDEVTETERRDADVRFMDMHASAVNIGDALVEVSVSDMPFGLRLAAALALEPLVTKQKWMEGSSFSDKARTLSMLMTYLRNDTTGCNKGVCASLCLCLCRVISFESPAPHWDVFLEECVFTILSGWESGDVDTVTPATFHYAVVVGLSEVCATNQALWWTMASVVIPRLLAGLEDVGICTQANKTSQCLLCLSIVSNLMQRRPRLSEVSEAQRPTSSFIFTDAFRQFIGNSLRWLTDSVFPTFAAAALDPALERKCELLLDIACHLISDIDFAILLFHCGTEFVARSWARGSALECLSGVLHTFPEVSLQFDAGAVTSTLLKCMAGAAAESENSDRSMDVNREAVLLESLQEDCVVPLGCTGGDISSTAGAVLELLIEANPQQLSSIMDSLCQYCSSYNQLTFVFRSSDWRAWSAALRCCCRVCAEKEVSLCDCLPDAENRLLGPLAQLIPEVGGYVAAELLDLISLCVARTSQWPTCDAFIALLNDIFNKNCACVEDVGDGHSCLSSNKDGTITVICRNRSEKLFGVATGVDHESLALLSVTVFALHRLLSQCDKSVLMNLTTKCDVHSWLLRSLAVIAHGCSLGVYCGIHAVRTLLSKAPRTAPLNSQLVVTAVTNACLHCTVPDASTLVTGLLRCLCDHTPGECALASQVLVTFTAQCVKTNPYCSILLRSLTDYTLSVVRMSLARSQDSEESYQGACIKCMASQLELCIPVVACFAVDDAPHDESTTRLLSKCFATLAASAASGYSIAKLLCERTAYAFIEVFCSSARERHSSRTLSAAAAALCAAAVASPALLDASDVLEILLPPFVASVQNTSGKGMDYVGCCLLLALFFLRHPQQINSVAASFSAEAMPQLHPQPSWSVALGVWSTVAPFADHFTSLYFIAAWCRLLRCMVLFRNQSGGVTDPFSVCSPLCCVYALPSLHVKSLNGPNLTGCSVALCIAIGLALIVHRGPCAAKSRLMDDDVLRPLYITRQLDAVAGCGAHEVETDMLTSLSVVESANWLLQYMVNVGYKEHVEMAIRFATKR